MTSVAEDLRNEHLSPEQIAAIVEGDAKKENDVILHLAECDECRARVTAVANLLDDHEVSAAMPSSRTIVFPRSSSTRWTMLATLAAAATVTIILANPINSGRDDSQAQREGTLTASAAPQILSDAVVSGAQDSLRWSAVSGADLYRVQLWNREGTVVWSADTRQTSAAIPDRLLRNKASYLWEVKARTGWDRWVSSDFLNLEVRLTP